METTLEWAKRRAKEAVEALEVHDDETRRLLSESKTGLRPLGFWDARDDERRSLAASLQERTAFLLRTLEVNP